jgi:hypothetical protein
MMELEWLNSYRKRAPMHREETMQKVVKIFFITYTYVEIAHGRGCTIKKLINRFNSQNGL